MALLPLAGWAENYSEWTVTLSATTSVYTGTEKSVAVTLTKAGQDAVTITSGEDGWTLAWTKGGEPVTTLKDAGVYTLTVTSGGPHTQPTNNQATYTITQAQNSISGLAITGWTYGDDANAPSCTPAFGAAAYTYCKDEDGNPDGDYGDYATKVAGQAGTYYVKATVTATDNYADATSDPVQFTIAKKNLKAKARAFTATQTIFGVFQNTTAVAIDYDGFVAGDDEGDITPPTAAIKTSVKADANCVTLSDTKKYIKAGNYSEALEVTGGSAANYEIICLNNDLNISKAKVKVDLKAAPTSAVFGSAAAGNTAEWPIAWANALTYLNVYRQTGIDGSGDPTYSVAAINNLADLEKFLKKKGAGTSESPYAFNTEVKITRANTSANVGLYPLTLSNVEGTADADVQPSTNSTNLKFQITEATLTIKASNKWKVYGTADPKETDGSWAYTVKAGGVDYDGLSDPQVAAIKAGLTRAEGETAGDYKISFSDELKANALFGDNYDITWTDGWLTIEKADLTITAKPQTLYKGNKVENLVQTEYEIEGLVNNANLSIDDAATVNLVFGTVDDFGVESEVPVSAVEGHVGELTTAGDYDYGIKVVLANAAALAENYNITLVNGALTVISLDDQIVLNFAADNTEALATANGKKISAKMGNKTMVKDNWHAMVLPFATTPLEISKVLDQYVIINRLSENSTADHIAFELEMSEIPAGEAFLIKSAEDIVWDGKIFAAITGDPGRPISNEISAEAKGGNKFVGVYKATSVQSTDAQKKAWLGNTSQKKADGTTPRENKWYEPYSAAKVIAPFEAYLMYAPGVTTAPLITVEEIDGTVTAISEVKAGEFQEVKADGWYTINGVKLQSAPTQKGIYINNGKKVILK